MSSIAGHRQAWRHADDVRFTHPPLPAMPGRKGMTVSGCPLARLQACRVEHLEDVSGSAALEADELPGNEYGWLTLMGCLRRPMRGGHRGVSPSCQMEGQRY